MIKLIQNQRKEKIHMDEVQIKCLYTLRLPLGDLSISASAISIKLRGNVAADRFFDTYTKKSFNILNNIIK